MRNTPAIHLDSRLSMIAQLVGRCECYADIGCDHGRLGAFMLQSHLCQRAILTDISEPSLNKARTLLGKAGLLDRVRLEVCDGIPILGDDVDTVVISGMGGTTIADILHAGRDKLGGARLVLQPNVGTRELRSALCEIGYSIVDENVIRDSRRLYVIIAARPGEAKYCEKQLIVGPVLLEKLPDALRPYAQFRLRVAQKAWNGASFSGDRRQMAPLEREISIWKGVLACLQR